MTPLSRCTALVVPTLSNFVGLADLFASVDAPVLPIVIPNWRERNSVAASWNRGIRKAEEAGAQVIIVANDDIVFHPGAIGAFERAVLLRPELIFSGFTVPQDDRLERKLRHRPDLACFAVGRGFLDTVGDFDESFSPAYFEDDDMRWRLHLLEQSRDAGPIDAREPHATYRHVGSQTQHRDPNDPVVSHERFRQLQDRYRLKWGGLPGHERFRVPFNEKE